MLPSNEHKAEWARDPGDISLDGTLIGTMGALTPSIKSNLAVVLVDAISPVING